MCTSLRQVHLCSHSSQFTAWTAYTDGLVIGVDLKVTEDYMSCLKHFATLGHAEHRDHETRNRYDSCPDSRYYKRSNA